MPSSPSGTVPTIRIGPNTFGDRFLGKDKLRQGLVFIFSLGFVIAGQSGGQEYTDIRF